MSKTVQIIFVVFLTLAIFIFTRYSFTSVFQLQAGFLCFFATVIYGYYIKKMDMAIGSNAIFVYFVIATVLFLVGSTGWFLSPFFFSLYFLGMYLAFVFSTPASLAFFFTLVGIFSFHIGDVDVTYDFLVVLSLLGTVPLTIFVRREYMRLKQAEKEILILEKDKEHYKDKIEEVLANKITNFAVNLRQPINDVKQLAFRLESQRTKASKDTYEKRIITASEQALTLLKGFEEDVTGKRLLTTPKIS